MSGFREWQRHHAFCRAVLSLDCSVDKWGKQLISPAFAGVVPDVTGSLMSISNFFAVSRRAELFRSQVTIVVALQGQAGWPCPWPCPLWAGRRRKGAEAPEDFQKRVALCLRVTTYQYKLWAWAEPLCAILFATPLGGKNLFVLREFKRSSVEKLLVSLLLN